MTMQLSIDPGETLRRLGKFLLMLRFVWRYPRRHGAWPKYEYLKPWIVALRPAAVIDIGANLGQFLHLARSVWPEAAIVGIEPQAELCDRLRRVYDGDTRVALHCCAAGADDGEAVFHVTRNHQNSSLLAPLPEFSDERPGDGLARTEAVAVRRADALLDGIEGPLFVKIDVQGAELAALAGFGARLSDIETLIVEAPFETAYDGASTFDDLYRFLTAAGFDYAGALGTLTSRRTGRVRQEDAIFVRPAGENAAHRETR